ncbi:MAG: hypothetical protein F4092_04345 [Rhodospirillaceae bacterium]|nr:hypothetical protein [Rhodospirillaceae bacterium]
MSAKPVPTFEEMVRGVKAHAAKYRDNGWGWDRIDTVTEADYQRLLVRKRSIQGAINVIHGHLRLESEEGQRAAPKRVLEGKDPIPRYAQFR